MRRTIRRAIRRTIRRPMLAACGLFALCALAGAQSRVAFAEYEITGPCTRVELDAGLAGSVVVEGALAAGETRRVVLPVPTSPGAPPVEPRAAVGGGGGSARLAGWREPALDRLSAALRARPAPVATAARVRAGLAVLGVLAAAGIAGLWSARRPFVALALAAAAACAVFVLARSSLARDAAPVEVLDGIAGDVTWQRARAARGALVLPGRGPTFALTTEPGHAPIRIEAPLDPGLPVRAGAPGALLVATWPEPWDARALDRAANALAPIATAWLREEGTWTCRGAWPLEAALGPAVEGPGPPGWLVSGLPQGRTLLVGELEPPRSGSPRTFVRCAYLP